MFAIATQQRQYLTYLLTDESVPSRLEIVPERGGIATRWQVRGQEILYLDAARFADPSLSIRGGIPVLFPICGNLPSNLYTYQGRTYSLKQHGFARDLPWEVTDSSTDGAASLTSILRSNDQTRAVYPFEFELAFTYRLQGQQLEIQQRYSNRSSEPMPFSTGLHPYFWVADKAQLAFEIPATQLQDQHTQETRPFADPFDFSQDEIDVGFRPLSRQTAMVYDRARQLQLCLQYDRLYTTLVFWTVKGKDYYCLEPWSASRNALNTGENLTQLPANADLETSVRFSVIF